MVARFPGRTGKQTVTTMSSTKSEYIGLSLVSKKGIWLRHILIEVGYYMEPNVQRVTIHSDNKPIISLTINLDHHFSLNISMYPITRVREQIQNGIIVIKYISTKKMPADGLTKPLMSRT